MCLISPRFLQKREMRVQRDGIFLSLSDLSLLSYWDGEKVSLTGMFVENFKEGLSGIPIAQSGFSFGIWLRT